MDGGRSNQSLALAAHFNFLLFRRSLSIFRSHLELQKYRTVPSRRTNIFPVPGARDILQNEHRCSIYPLPPCKFPYLARRLHQHQDITDAYGSNAIPREDSPSIIAFQYLAFHLDGFAVHPCPANDFYDLRRCPFLFTHFLCLVGYVTLSTYPFSVFNSSAILLIASSAFPGSTMATEAQPLLMPQAEPRSF
jgi:hypothetical protein